MSRYVAKHLRPKQQEWTEASQARISMTSSVLGSMKSVMMVGISEAVLRRLQELRDVEFYRASKVRWIMVAYNSSGELLDHNIYSVFNLHTANFLGVFTPTITICVFAIIAWSHGKALDVETAFTTIAILLLVTHPANMLMTMLPRFIAALTSFERVQTYLLESSREDHRTDLRTTSQTQSLAVQIAGLRVEAPGSGDPILHDINIEVEKGSITTISGRVGSGKTTLVGAILGELIPAAGTVSISSKRIALCSQTPWLPNTSIKNAIQGYPSRRDGNLDWYKQVIQACCLEQDLASLPNEDDTIVGSRGMNLSGGQRQRVVRNHFSLFYFLNLTSFRL
jgi:ATP-binding cassette subfamily C (CFTR/MRP) protein 1